MNEARDIIKQMRALTPVIVPDATHGDLRLRELYLSGLRLAAGETT